MSPRPRALCLVVPVFNEAELLARSLPQIFACAEQAAPGATVHLVAVDDGSTDASARCLQELQGHYPQLRVLGFTRNFGKEAAIQAGLEYAHAHTDAEVFVVIDADLQHPPALIGPMLDRWRQGARVVEAVKRSRGDESWLRRGLARIFYRLFSRLSGLPMDGATDFKLLDRRVVGEVLTLAERTRFFRGIVSWLGYPVSRIDFDVPARDAGSSSWGSRALFRYAWRNLTAFSSAPLHLVTLAGVLGLSVGALLGAKALLDKLSGHALSGFSTVILLQVMFGSLILLSLGLIGSYVARIYDEIKRRPHYILRPDPPRAPSSDGGTDQP